MTERQSRRAEHYHRCPVCIALQVHSAEPVCEEHLRYWTERFSDVELAFLASEMLNEDVPVERIRCNRIAFGV